MRFVHNIKAAARGQKSDMKSSPQIEADEFEAVQPLLWRNAQAKAFSEDINALDNRQPLPSNSRLRQLTPLVDKHGVLRLRSRLAKADCLNHSTKQPVVLAPEQPFTKLLIQHYHQAAGHQCQELVLNEIRQRYWVLTGRSAVKLLWILSQKCKNASRKPQVPMMGDLPASRLTPNIRPFATTGVDYFGPLTVKVGRRYEKRCGVLFTCLVTRAVHLEIATSLTMAIRRFTARRGHPAKMYSDNGTNLHGVDKELSTALSALQQDQLTTELTLHSIQWHFNPPAAPHMGGVWERLVHSVKSALRAIMDVRTPSDEVLATAFAEAEVLVNSRPLTHVSVDPNDPEALTPSHLMISTSSPNHPITASTDADLCLRKGWRIAQCLADMFWQRWVKEYLPELSRRTKWHKDHASAADLAMDDVVIIADSNLPPGSWIRGRVVATHPGKDGRVRVVDVKTQTGTYRRPVARLCKLDVHKQV
ncbi:uncharacterized protein LOC135829105 [Sycon ciliatum]|uniref:uncharacterized protein LOC135829105 n=1 Tax=Sycon ciliatum TaxID=27933 RepID=UPI0031F60EC5